MVTLIVSPFFVLHTTQDTPRAAAATCDYLSIPLPNFSFFTHEQQIPLLSLIAVVLPS
ncbi:hypothetical protein BJV78DRAFT_1179430 [Lactifluus subvellereus]|nr:hypothetical protein BJV78DRAFT_1179430 [Lactifluus subvellereus]